MEQEKGISTLTGILIALLVAIIAAGGIWYYFNYYLNPAIEESSSGTQITIPEKESEEAASEEEATTGETADWKTYTNTKYGFSFKYPKDWYVHENDNENILTITNLSTSGVNKGNRDAILKKEGKTLYEGIYISESEASADYVIRMEDKIIGGKKIRISYYSNSENPESTSVYKKSAFWKNSDGKNISVSTMTETGSEKEEIVMFDQILSTFQFTK